MQVELRWVIWQRAQKSKELELGKNTTVALRFCCPHFSIFVELAVFDQEAVCSEFTPVSNLFSVDLGFHVRRSLYLHHQYLPSLVNQVRFILFLSNQFTARFKPSPSEDQLPCL